MKQQSIAPFDQFSDTSAIVQYEELEVMVGSDVSCSFTYIVFYPSESSMVAIDFQH